MRRLKIVRILIACSFEKIEKSQKWPILVTFGPILAMFLKSRPYDFDAFAYIGL